MMNQGAAAAATLGHHHLAAMAGEQAHRRLIDRRAKDLLDATAEQRHPHAPRALGLIEPLSVLEALRGLGGGSGGQHAPEPAAEQRCEGVGQAGAQQSPAEQPGPGQEIGEKGAHRAVRPAPIKLRVEEGPAVIDQPLVIDPRGAIGLAGEAGQAAIQMPGGLGRRRLAALEHFLDQ